MRLAQVLQIAVDQWRYWRISRLAWLSFSLFFTVLAGVALLTATDMMGKRELRLAHQADAEQRFAAQPDRHPHRMVHYGHYVFRSPAPLSVIDPGIDSVTGRSLFLEGHRQNSATFAEAQASANTGGVGSLTTAFMYQILVPLLLIALGHGIVLRERESRTLTTLLGQGVSTTTLVLGKASALASLVLFLTTPLLLASAFAVSLGESWRMATTLCITYLAYLLVWATAVLSVSLWLRERRFALLLLLGAWVAMTLILPRAAVAVLQALNPARGHIERTLDAQEQLAKAGDGHNPADPAFEKLRDELLAQHQVDKVADLPINLRGVVAERAEAAQARVLNDHAESRMAHEAEQERAISALGWLSPVSAIGAASRSLSGTDLATHHRFLREAEALRLEFVQRLNRLHATKLSYDDDLQRSRSADAERRTRVKADNWDLLRTFRFSQAEPQDRYAAASTPWLMLWCWGGGLGLLTLLGIRRLSP